MNFGLDDAPTAEDLSIEDMAKLSEEYGIIPQDLDGETPLRDLQDSETPSKATKKGNYWILHGAQDCHDYCAANGILTPDKTTEADLPATDHETVRELDREALEKGELGGKWNVFLSEAEVDATWECVKSQIDKNVLYRAKVSTKWSREESGHEEHVIVVYTPNYFDESDLFRVREALREQCGIEQVLYYKPDFWTLKGIYAGTAKEYGLPGASRYSG